MLVERSPIDPGTSDYNSCQYVLLALDPLEELQKEDHRSQSDTVEHILELSKHALTLDVCGCISNDLTTY